LNGSRREKESAIPPVPTEVDLVLARFRLRARIRAAWLQTIWVRQRSSNGEAGTADSELALLLADADSPEAERDWAASHEVVRHWLSQLKALEHELRCRDAAGGRFARLAWIFGLDTNERDLLEASFAVASDPGLARVCAYLHDHPGRLYLSENLVARLYGHGRVGKWTAESSVFRWEFVTRHNGPLGEPAAVNCDPQIRDWLMGRHTLDGLLVGFARVQETREPLSRWPVADIAAWIRQAVQKNLMLRLRIIVSGPPGSGRKCFAAAVAQHLRHRLLVIDADAFDDGDWSSVFLHAQRQAFLDSCALAWTGESLARRHWPSRCATFPVQFCLCIPAQEPAGASGVFERRLLLPSSTVMDRVRLWRQHVPAARKWSGKKLQKLAEQHPVNPGDIVHAGRNDVAGLDEAARCARESARSRFNELVQQLECPFRSNDLVVPVAVREALESLAYEARHRHRFWEDPSNRRLFPQGRGLAALFSGTPGTGKTMAAQIIAAELGQDLFRVNLAHLVSKWVGETAKNVDWLLREAAALDAVIFFDEADAAFAKRSTEVRDAQDRFANTDAAHLLQAIENYPGVVLLATNLKGNIDPAFFRRLRYVIEFPKPDADLQRKLWALIIQSLAGAAVGRNLQKTIDLLSANVEATGAQIKYAVLAAVFLAQRKNSELNARHLLDGLQGELVKEGRGIGPRERERILKVESTK
jgi:AAA+ superfamily predicted ATPase